MAVQPLKIDALASWLKRGEREVFTEVVTMTPLLAHRLLERNADNRPLRENGTARCVQAYAAAMERGEWVVNGAPIIMSRDGLLNDGQHRLNAVVKANVSVPMQITFGVERETRHTIDQGAARTPGNILAMHGERNTNQLAHAIQFVWAYDGYRGFSNRPSPDELLSTLDAHPGLREAIKDVSTVSNEFKVSNGYLAGAHYVCQRFNPILANGFVESVRTGLHIKDSGSPVLKLRKRFQDHLAGRDKMLAQEQAALWIKAFNGVIANRNVRNLLWRQNGPAAEDFPMVGA